MIGRRGRMIDINRKTEIYEIMKSRRERMKVVKDAHFTLIPSCRIPNTYSPYPNT